MLIKVLACWVLVGAIVYWPLLASEKKMRPGDKITAGDHFFLLKFATLLAPAAYWVLYAIGYVILAAVQVWLYPVGALGDWYGSWPLDVATGCLIYGMIALMVGTLSALNCAVKHGG